MIQGTCTGRRTGNNYPYIVFEPTEECVKFLLEKGFKKIDLSGKNPKIETSKNNIFNAHIELDEPTDIIFIVFDPKVGNHPHFVNYDQFITSYESDLKELIFRLGSE